MQKGLTAAAAPLHEKQDNETKATSKSIDGNKTLLSSKGGKTDA